jgi:hypothetical protein
LTYEDNAGDLKILVGRKIKCQNGLTIYFVHGFLDENPILPSKNLTFHDSLCRQMFVLHNILGEAYPTNCTVGYNSESY